MILDGKKTLFFAGAGNLTEDCSDVGNCRIRTAFTNRDGKKVYLELHKGWKNNYMSADFPENYCYVEFAHYITGDIDDACINKLPVDHSLAKDKPWSLESILNIVNNDCGGDFETVKVLNRLTGGYCVHDGENYNYGDEFIDRREEETA